MLEQLADAVRGGESRVLVLHGEAGVGKTALLDHLARHAPGSQVTRAAGVQSEMELAFAGLHQLCAPVLDCLDTLPAPQREALRIAFGMSSGSAPDRFLIGLAVLSLLSHAAARRALLCLVDDYQWLDRASALILAFAARRLGAESVGLVFATRDPGDDLAGLPELGVTGLREADARVLLDAALSGPIDARVRDQIIAETRGNPLALLELPRGLTAEELADGFGLPGALPLAGSIEQNFQRRVGALPPPTQRLLLLAAADPSGDPALVWRAAALLGIGTAAAVPAIDAGLAEFGTRLLFRHPLARSAVYQAVSAQARQEAHHALAEATDPRLDPDRRAWHRAQAVPGPDEGVAAELERSADRARSRGGLTAAAAFLERSATLTLDPATRAARALAAARAKSQAGAYSAALDLLAVAEAGPLTDVQHAHADLVRAQLAFFTSRGAEAPPLLLKAARRLSSVDPALSRATYLDALSAGIFTNRLATPGCDLLEIARAAAEAPPPPRPPRSPDLMLDALTAHYNEGYAAGVPLLRSALARFGDGMSAEEELRWLWLVCAVAATRAWDDASWDVLSARHVQLARDAGALSELPLALTSRAFLHLFAGQLSAAAALTDEMQAVKEATGTGLASYGALGLAAFRGEEARTQVLIAATMEDATLRGEGNGITFAEWANAVLGNGLGRYDKAAEAALHACDYANDLGSLVWVMPELIEAAARAGLSETAAWADGQLEEMTSACVTDWAYGIRARSRALLSEGETAERLYRESIRSLGRTRLRVPLARAHLLYGEWLRRERRRSAAREQLRTAYGMFEATGMAGFAERARRELRSTGESARKRGPGAGHEELTAQELLVARLARDGLSNPEIGTRLFISAHTVQYHLRKVFTKLGITSRSQLDRVLPTDAPAAQPGAVLCPARLYQPGFVGEDHGLHPVAQAELHKNPPDVRLGGLLGDDQALTDLGVGQAAGDQLEYLALPRGQRSQLRRQGGRGTRSAPREVRDQPPGHRGREQRLPGGHHPDRVHEFGGGRVLEHEPAGAGPQCLVHVLVQVERGEHQHAGLAGPGAEQFPGRGEPVHDRHPHVHQHHVGPQPLRLADRLGAVRGLPADPDAVLRAEQRTESFAHHRLVVGDQAADHDAGPPGGSSARTANPPPGSAPAFSQPPSSAARSRMPPRPWPVPWSRGWPAAGPLSTQRRTTAGSTSTAMLIAAPGACRPALDRASCTIR